VIQGEKYKVLLGNNLDLLPTLEANSVDSIVTDPPYELGFMGKKWDSTGIAYNADLWRECLRVLKPGGHLLSFGGTRTWHRIAVAIEDAGFEVRDSIAWMYGSGFPKSLDIAKAIDKQSGYQGEVIGVETIDVGMQGGSMHAGRDRKLEDREIKKLSDQAQQWEGWGTALKPAFEPIVVARKPLIGTVAENVLTHGTGGLNIDGSRIGTTDNLNGGRYSDGKDETDSVAFGAGVNKRSKNDFAQPAGRWPANVILDEYTAGLLDEQSGILKSGSLSPYVQSHNGNTPTSFATGVEGTIRDVSRPKNEGGASRFFYVAKASKRDRNEGLEELPEVRAGGMSATLEGSMLTGAGNERTTTRQNFHPTVKPTALMEYLIKLVTPPNGLVLDPFTGSGSTGKAAILSGFRFLGIEMTEEYFPIIEGRLRHAETQGKENEGLF
jgi:DNA modification methylase